LVDAGEQTEDKLSDLLNSVTVDKYLRVVDIAEIKQNDFNLNISRYIDTSEEDVRINIELVLSNLKSIDQELSEIDSKLSKHLAQLKGI
ncbi:N-6 DNA methylase, partial [Vibrio cholerae]